MLQKIKGDTANFNAKPDSLPTFFKTSAVFYAQQKAVEGQRL